MHRGLPDSGIDALVIGSGLGGLLTAALLLEKGLKVLVCERLPFCGGRFTSIDHNDFSVPTGAAHMIPFGTKGVLGKTVMNDLKLDSPLIPTKAYAGVDMGSNSERYVFKRPTDVFSIFSSSDKLSFMKSVMACMLHIEPDETFIEYVERKRFSDEIKRFYKAFVGFLLGLSLSEVKVAEVFALGRHILIRGRHPAVPRRGCAGLIDALCDHIVARGGHIRTNAEAVRINVVSGKVAGTSIRIRDSKNDETHDLKSAIVISDMGHQATINIIDDRSCIPMGTIAKITDARPVGGIGFVYGLDKSVTGHSGMVLTPNCERICGVIEPTHTDRTLAPKGKHLFISHQPILSQDIKGEIAKGRADLYSTFPQLDVVAQELCVHTFRDMWPVNRTPQGDELPNDIGIEGLYLVGDGCKAEGLPMSEGVAYSAKKAVNRVIHH